MFIAWKSLVGAHIFVAIVMVLLYCGCDGAYKGNWGMAIDKSVAVLTTIGVCLALSYSNRKRLIVLESDQAYD